MEVAIAVAVVAAIPPTLAAILSYVASKRALRRSVGDPGGVPLRQIVLRLERKLDTFIEGQAEVRERLARVETDQHRHALRAGK